MNHKMKTLRESIIRGSHKSKEGHIPSALSILDILWVLYDKVLQPNHDHFILSKGHASLGLYAVLSEKGHILPNDLNTFCSFDSLLGGHPDRNKITAVEASTGSLGHGLPIAVGVALGMKIKKSIGRVYTIIGDGEANEGTVWESALLASHQKLGNLCVIVDYNHSTDRALKVGDLTAKFTSFGWKALNIDGHNQEEILKCLRENTINTEVPLALIANTIKGNGIKSMEHNPAWHHKSPNDEELSLLINEIHTHD
jgi:transketolase